MDSEDFEPKGDYKKRVHNADSDNLQKEMLFLSSLLADYERRLHGLKRSKRIIKKRLDMCKNEVRERQGLDRVS